MPADRFKKKKMEVSRPQNLGTCENKLAQQKKNLQDLELVLTHCGGVDRFKQGPFGQYLDMVHPIKVHGMLIYNFLKRQLILLKSNKDEI